MYGYDVFVCDESRGIQPIDRGSCAGGMCFVFVRASR